MRRYLIFVAAGLGLLMSSIDGTVVAVALPSLIEDLGTNLLWAAWTISIYFIATTMAMPIAGNLSDSFGRKNVFLISLILFTGSSLACGFAPGIYSLILFRFIQGIGGACFLPTAAGMVSDHFPEHRERAIGLFTSIYPIGGVIGPNLGAWIVSRYSWRYVFYINVPVGVGLMVLIMMLLKGSKASSRRHVDLAGAFFMSGAILFLMFGLNLIGESFSLRSLLLAALFLLLSFSLLFLFIRHEKKEPHPIVDMTLLQSRPFLAANVLNMVIGAGAWGILSFIPLYATSVYKLSTLLSGMILTPRSLGMIFASTVTSFLLRRWGYRWPMVWGLGMISCSTILLGEGVLLASMIGIQWGAAEVISFLILFSGIGSGIAFPAANNACIELLPEKVATIVGLRGMFRTVGAALGVSLITFILHLSSNPAAGFRITFVACGLAILFTIPLVFLMPAGKKEWAERSNS
jgi:EmrB/QacA subfamily drug resistance transporter